MRASRHWPWLILICYVLLNGSVAAQTATEHFEQASKFYSQGRYEETLAACDRALAIDPQMADAYRRKGWAYWQLGKFESAVEEFARAIELEADDPMHFNGRASALYNLERYDEALRDADRAIALKPDYVNAYINRGLIRKARGENDRAARDLEQAVRLDPSNTLAWTNLGAVRGAVGDDRGALEAFDRALKINPEYVTARHNRSWRRREVRDLAGAIEDAEWLIENRPRDADGYDLLGRVRMVQERYSDAAKLFERVIELDPKGAGGHHLLGFNRLKAGDLRGGESELSRALDLDPNNVGALLDRGITRRRLGDFDGAIEDYDRRIDLLPDDPYAYNNRGTIYMDMGEPKRAKRDFETALRLDPNHESAAGNLRKAEKAIGVADGNRAGGATAGSGTRSSGPWDPGPLTAVLFDGELREKWLPHSAAGGDFNQHARVSGGTLYVDVPPGRAWGKVGIFSAEPMVWLDRFGPGAETEVAFHLDPAATTGVALALALPGWGGVGGNDPGYPNVTFYWIKDRDGGTASAELHLNPHRQGEYWSQAVADRAPGVVSFRLRPGSITVSSPGLFEQTETWSHAAPGQGFRIWTFSQPGAADVPVRMALKQIVLNRTAVPETSPRPAKGVADLPVATLFEGRSDPRWQGIGVAGGSFERFARYRDGRLLVNVPEGNSWGKTGLLSEAPVLELDQHTALSPKRITVRVDPAATTGLVLALSTEKTADMWPNHAIWAGVFQHEDGTVELGLHNSAYQDWSRTVRAGWNGELELIVGDEWAALSIEGGPTIRGATLPVGPGSKLYATLISHPTQAGAPSRLSVEWIGVDRVAPPGMSSPQRWMLLDDQQFDADEFLEDLARAVSQVRQNKGGGS
jgi:tetratricopeptide (TPR) repeat protein